MLVMFSILSSIILYVVEIIVIKTTYERDRVSEIENARDVISASYGSIGYQNTIYSLSKSKVLYIYVLNEKGEVLNVVGKGGVKNAPLPQDNIIIPDIFQIMDSTNGYYSYRVPDVVDGSEWIVDCQVVANWDGSREVIFVYGSLAPINDTLGLISSRAFIVMGILLIITTILSIFIAGYFSRPIIQLTHNAELMADGEYEGINDIKSNFTELKRLSKTLKMAAGEFARTELLRKELIANVSHDLRTPLTTIKAYAELIETVSGNDEKARKENLRIIIEETDKLTRFVNDTLDLSRLQSNTMQVNLQVLSLGECVEDVLGNFRHMIDHGTKKTFLSLDCDAYVKCDASLIKRAIFNLINNSFRFTVENGTVFIGVSQLDGEVLFEVIDDGKGIAKDKINEIWTRYYQVDRFSDKSPGIGVGLSIAEAIFKLHGAKYDADSIEGEGSRFWFSLPSVN